MYHQYMYLLNTLKESWLCRQVDLSNIHIHIHIHIRNQPGVKKMKWEKNLHVWSLGLAFCLCSGMSPAQTAPAGLMDKMQKNGCTGCHAIEKKLVGPAFKEVAHRYKNDKAAEAKLVAKIKAGGSGAWGAIPMPPQSIKDEEAKAMVTLLLQLP
jgi:cytochrome c